MPKLRNGNNGDSNPGSLDCESGILPTELPRSTDGRVTSLPFAVNDKGVLIISQWVIRPQSPVLFRSSLLLDVWTLYVLGDSLTQAPYSRKLAYCRVNTLGGFNLLKAKI